jgi:hypothetical protein
MPLNCLNEGRRQRTTDSPLWNLDRGQAFLIAD